MKSSRSEPARENWRNKAKEGKVAFNNLTIGGFNSVSLEGVNGEKPVMYTASPSGEVVFDQRTALAVRKVADAPKRWLMRPTTIDKWTFKAFPGQSMMVIESGAFKGRTVVGNYATFYHDIRPQLLADREYVMHLNSAAWDSADIWQLSITDAAGTNGYTWKWTRSGFPEWYGSGRRALAFSLRDIKTIIGAPNLATTQFAKIAFTAVQNGASAQAEPWIYGIEIVPARARASAVIMADDCLSSWFTTAIPMLQAAGIYNTTVAVIADKIGTPGFATLSQLRTFVDSGGECVVHGPMGVYEGGDLRKYSTFDGVYSDLCFNRDYLVANGIAKNGSETIYVFPRGIYDFSTGDDTIYRALRAAGFKAARVTAEASGALLASNPAAWTYVPERLDAHSAYRIPIIGHTWSSTDETANITRINATIDALVAAKAPFTFMGHDCVTTATMATQIATTNMQAIINRCIFHADAGNLDFMTPTQQWLQYLVDEQSLI